MKANNLILIVEDNRDDELLTLDALRSAGVNNPVAVVRDGQAALDYLFMEGKFAGRDPGQNPCLVLLDLKLPKINGHEVLRRIKTDERTHEIPVLVLTASSDKDDIEFCYRNGANSYINKPLEFDKFLEAVRHLGLEWSLMSGSGA